jgi:hypothetical protein
MFLLTCILHNRHGCTTYPWKPLLLPDFLRVRLDGRPDTNSIKGKARSQHVRLGPSLPKGLSATRLEQFGVFGVFAGVNNK